MEMHALYIIFLRIHFWI